MNVQVSETKWRIDKGFVPNMRVPGYFYVNSALEPLILDELRAHVGRGGQGGFLPAVKQIANVVRRRRRRRGGTSVDGHCLRLRLCLRAKHVCTCACAKVCAGVCWL